MKRLDGSLKRNLMLEFYWNSRLLEVLDVCCEFLRKIADSDISARSAGGPSRLHINYVTRIKCRKFK